MSSLNGYSDSLDNVLIDRINTCISDNSELNGWEDDFLESILTQAMQGRELSNRQLETLEKLEYIVEWGRDSYWGLTR